MNPQAKLLAHAKNDKLFQKDEDVEHLAKEIRYALVGDGNQSNIYRTIVLKKQWRTAPWADIEEKDHPQHWDNRIPVIVMPKASLDNKELGEWLKTHVAKARNTVRFLLPRVGTGDIFYDKSLLVLARAVYLASDWKNSEREYAQLHLKYQKELREQLQSRLIVLQSWSCGISQTHLNASLRFHSMAQKGYRSLKSWMRKSAASCSFQKNSTPCCLMPQPIAVAWSTSSNS
ncbi:hypothetical protein O5290_26245 [Escherichia coli]|nr:hypothetical protein [Escherichia coli]